MKEGEKNTDKRDVEKIIQGHFIRYFFDFYNLDLNSDEIHVLNIICSFELDNKTYTGSQKYLCTLLKFSKPRALRVLNQLTIKGYLIKEASKGKQSSIYKINFTFLKEQLLNSAKSAQLTNDNKDVNYGEITQLDTKTNCNDLLQSKSQNCNDLLHQLSQNITVNCNKTLHNKNIYKNNNKNIYAQSKIDASNSLSQEDDTSNTKKEADTKVPTSEKKKKSSSKKDRYAKDDYITDIEVYTQNKELQEALLDFYQMRKQNKKPISTARTTKRLLSKLDNLSDNDNTKIAIVNQSTDHCWQGFFELKNKEAAGNSQPQEVQPPAYKEWQGDEEDEPKPPLTEEEKAELEKRAKEARKKMNLLSGIISQN